MNSDLKERIMPLLREMDDIYSGSNRKIIEILDEYEQRMKGAIEWTVLDMMSAVSMTSMNHWELSEEDAQKALEEMIENHDANLGITWETVTAYISKYKPE